MRMSIIKGKAYFRVEQIRSIDYVDDKTLKVQILPYEGAKELGQWVVVDDWDSLMIIAEAIFPIHDGK